MTNKFAAGISAALLALSSCTTPQPVTVSSQGQSGGVNANNIGTVNQSVLPKIKSPFLPYLQDQWADGAALYRVLKNSSLTDEQIDQQVHLTMVWVNSTASWIQQHMTRAAAEKFVLVRGTSMSWILTGAHKPGEAEKWSNTLNALENWLDNLDALMRSDEMYPQ
ncbi:MAG: hypothetical protein JO056_11895 [Alphaproteobacteria bacterium]|nr:hypothetical protein [Alphaproteobacteria bacterium]